MNSWQHSGFHVFAGDAIEPHDTERLLFLSRYLKRSPVALERLSIIEDGAEPVVRIIKSCDEPDIYRDFSPLEFLAELSQHVPDTWEQTTRYVGIYSARTRGKINALPKPTLTFGLTEFLDEPEKRPISSTWARLIKKIYEVDPLVCEQCGAEMKIIAFVHRENEIKKICDSLGLEDWRAPPATKHAKQQTLLHVFDDLQYGHLDS